jgi:uncharacterized protein (DUF1499 family)
MAGVRDVWVRAALALSLAVPVYFAAAALGVKFGLLDWTLGFGKMTVGWGVYVLTAAAAIALIGLALALLVPPRRGALMALPAFSQPVCAARARMRPGGDDDLVTARVPDQPRFGDKAGRLVTELEQAAYPQVKPFDTALEPAAAFDQALAAARAQGWRLGKVDRDARVIEASARSFWFGFVDDIVVRVRAGGAGSRIDIRSASRVGVSDLGANAKRIESYLAALRAANAV